MSYTRFIVACGVGVVIAAGGGVLAGRMAGDASWGASIAYGAGAAVLAAIFFPNFLIQTYGRPGKSARHVATTNDNRYLTALRRRDVQVLAVVQACSALAALLLDSQPATWIATVIAWLTAVGLFQRVFLADRDRIVDDS